MAESQYLRELEALLAPRAVDEAGVAPEVIPDRQRLLAWQASHTYRPSMVFQLFRAGALVTSFEVEGHSGEDLRRNPIRDAWLEGKVVELIVDLNLAARGGESDAGGRVYRIRHEMGIP